ncbi:McrC family protein [Dickeya oryzae]|uniref:McrC family protein n=1 Tax=Dickeya oryzae TaxID=1240404 RepID=UPI001AEC88A6|nr:McrC family protein [Dickeya oryzae]MBP2847607.1 McrC family protein [Dickeya oryzae]
MHKVISVFEYGCVGADPVRLAGVTAVPPPVFRYLESLALDEQGCPFLRLTSRKGHRLIQVQNYAGVLASPFGIQLEILPKIGRTSSLEQARHVLLNMLAALPDFRHIQTQQALVQTQRMTLLEIFISQFLQSVSQLIRQGLRSDYVSQQGNLSFIKGKLLLPEQLRRNSVNRHKFWVEFEDYLPDCPANRLLHSALNLVSQWRLSSENQRECQMLRFAFDGIPLSRDIDRDIGHLRVDRNMVHYQVPLAWAKLILTGMSPLVSAGNAGAISLLFPMEALFEAFVAQTLPEEIPAGEYLKVQAAELTLVSYADKTKFKLNPDLLLQSGRSTRNLAVLDTKWKLIGERQLIQKGKQAETINGLSESDFYQMFAYGQRYLAGKGDMYLIYPEHDEFTRPVRHPFKFSETLRLWVVPYRISVFDGKKMHWPHHEYKGVNT